MSLRRSDEEQQVHDHLAAAGVESDLETLASAGSQYPAEAVPVLVRELDGPYSEMTLEMIARAIGNKAARPYWDELIDRYRRGTPGEIPNTGLLPGLAQAIAKLATKADLEVLLELSDDRSRGQSRITFFKLIKRWGGERGIEVLQRQLDDPLATVEATHILKRAKRLP